MFEDLIRAIKLWSKLLVVVVFEGRLLIRLQTKEHLIPFKMKFKAMLINLLLHSVLSHDQIIFESAKNISPSCEGFVDLLYLGDSWK
jgi:hypothetical protein